jgi:hypothetical protein
MRLDARGWVNCSDMHFLRLLQGSQCWRHKDQRRAQVVSLKVSRLPEYTGLSRLADSLYRSIIIYISDN